jgi:hypothetical protein
MGSLLVFLPITFDMLRHSKFMCIRNKMAGLGNSQSTTLCSLTTHMTGDINFKWKGQHACNIVVMNVDSGHFKTFVYSPYSVCPHSVNLGNPQFPLLATWEAEIWRIIVLGQLRKISHKILSQQCLGTVEYAYHSI